VIRFNPVLVPGAYLLISRPSYCSLTVLYVSILLLVVRCTLLYSTVYSTLLSLCLECALPHVLALLLVVYHDNRNFSSANCSNRSDPSLGNKEEIIGAKQGLGLYVVYIIFEKTNMKHMEAISSTYLLSSLLSMLVLARFLCPCTLPR